MPYKETRNTHNRWHRHIPTESNQHVIELKMHVRLAHANSSVRPESLTCIRVHVKWFFLFFFGSKRNAHLHGS